VTWTFIFMMLVLKIPIAALIYLVWWAVHQTPEPAESTGGGGTSVRPHPHRRPPRPRQPRRGPHGQVALPSPPRVRTVRAQARRVEH